MVSDIAREASGTDAMVFGAEVKYAWFDGNSWCEARTKPNNPKCPESLPRAGLQSC